MMSFLLVCILIANSCVVQVYSQRLSDSAANSLRELVARGPTAVKEICQILKEYTYYDELGQKCYLKIPQGVHKELFDKGILDCHLSSRKSSWSAGDDGSDDGPWITQCLCPDHLQVNPDKVSCSEGKFCNEPCNNEQEIRCNQYAGLECNNNICTCDKDAIWNSTDLQCYSELDCMNRNRGSYFDENEGSCYISLEVEISCKLADPSDSLTSSHIERIPKAPTCPPNSKCSHGSHSSKYGLCRCNHGYGSDSNRKKCIPVKTYKQACETNKDGVNCDKANGLECKNNFCECEGKTQFEKRSASCKAPVGGKCSSSSYNEGPRCGKNSNCNSFEKTRYPESRYERKCECQTGFTDIIGFCFAKHLDACTKNDDCLDAMLCIDEVCRCAMPLGQKISKDGLKCLNLVGSPCNEQTTHVSGAGCSNGTTTCAPKFTPSINGECLMPFGSSCGEPLQKLCDFELGLACIDKSCSCLDPSLKHIAGVGCVASVGRTCGEIFQVGTSKTEDSSKNKYHIRCEKPSVCSTVTKSLSKCIIKS